MPAIPVTTFFDVDESVENVLRVMKNMRVQANSMDTQLATDDYESVSNYPRVAQQFNDVIDGELARGLTTTTLQQNLVDRFNFLDPSTFQADFAELRTAVNELDTAIRNNAGLLTVSFDISGNRLFGATANATQKNFILTRVNTIQSKFS